jgi:diaminohydroxyphosphoribosylaminopyrimidine deaminase / 5-amino-6-(5-phosphoribosylamino)uracil reductase
MNFMRTALLLAERGRYSVNPNPLVGCVIELNGKIVGQGWHQQAGSPHAEIIALRAAGHRARGANVYVTLEPCCHYGRTPPCVDALIEAQVKAVHIPFIDPNPLVNGAGVAKLRAAGIEVLIGAAAQIARQQNQIFLHHIATGRPFVVAKWAMTLDGQFNLTATAHDNTAATHDTTNASHIKATPWITQLPARRHSHYTRCWLGAVLVGANTVIADDPLLTPHLLADGRSPDADNQDGDKQNDQNNPSPPPHYQYLQHPWRIVLDGAGRSPLSAKLFTTAPTEKTIVATTNHSPSAWRHTLRDRGVKVIEFATSLNNSPANSLANSLTSPQQSPTVALPELLDTLGALGITGLLVEGGKKVLNSFIAARLINQIHTYVAPQLSHAQHYRHTYQTVESIGNDLLLTTNPIGFPAPPLEEKH